MLVPTPERVNQKSRSTEVELAEAGLQAGDIITGIEGVTVRTFDDLVSYLLNNTEVGQEITLTVLRDGEQIDLPLTLQARPSAESVVQQEQSQVAVSIEEAIQAAREAVTAAGLMSTIDSSSAELQSDGTQSVWVVSLSGNGRTATVLVDANSGEVIGLNVS